MTTTDVPIDKGVAFTAPVGRLLEDATALVDQMTAQLEPGTHGAVIGLATAKGWNAAIVHRVGDQFVVASFIGKSWDGGLTGGAAVKASW